MCSGLQIRKYFSYENFIITGKVPFLSISRFGLYLSYGDLNLPARYIPSVFKSGSFFNFGVSVFYPSTSYGFCSVCGKHLSECSFNATSLWSPNPGVTIATVNSSPPKFDSETIVVVSLIPASYRPPGPGNNLATMSPSSLAKYWLR